MISGDGVSIPTRHTHLSSASCQKATVATLRRATGVIVRSTETIYFEAVRTNRANPGYQTGEKRLHCLAIRTRIIGKAGRLRMRPNRSLRSASTSCWARAEELLKRSAKQSMRYRQPTSETLHGVPIAVAPRSYIGGIVVLSLRQFKSAKCRDCRLLARSRRSVVSPRISAVGQKADLRTPIAPRL